VRQSRQQFSLIPWNRLRGGKPANSRNHRRYRWVNPIVGSKDAEIEHQHRSCAWGRESKHWHSTRAAQGAYWRIQPIPLEPGRTCRVPASAVAQAPVVPEPSKAALSERSLIPLWTGSPSDRTACPIESEWLIECARPPTWYRATGECSDRGTAGPCSSVRGMNLCALEQANGRSRRARLEGARPGPRRD